MKYVIGFGRDAPGRVYVQTTIDINANRSHMTAYSMHISHISTDPLAGRLFDTPKAAFAAMDRIPSSGVGASIGVYSVGGTEVAHVSRFVPPVQHVSKIATWLRRLL